MLRRVKRIFIMKLLGLDQLYDPDSDLRRALDKIAESDSQFTNNYEEVKK